MPSVRAWVIGLALLLAVLPVLGGCQPKQSPDEASIQRTIERYNQLLTEGYRSLNMNPMQEVATSLQAQDEYIHMSSLAEGGVRLDPALKSMTFQRVSIESTSATAETREVWDYRNYSRANGELVSEQKGLVYVLAWDLARQPDGKWLVSDVRAISSTSTSEPTVYSTVTPTPPAK